MSKPQPSSTDELCPMCRRPKSKHTQEELAACSRKMLEFKKEKEGGAGIQ
ncbi:MAG: hypothetical protein ACE5EJ_00865 [Nitrosopumilaceae archaeon]